MVVDRAIVHSLKMEEYVINMLILLGHVNAMRGDSENFVSIRIRQHKMKSKLLKKNYRSK